MGASDPLLRALPAIFLATSCAPEVEMSGGVETFRWARSAIWIEEQPIRGNPTVPRHTVLLSNRAGACEGLQSYADATHDALAEWSAEPDAEERCRIETDWLLDSAASIGRLARPGSRTLQVLFSTPTGFTLEEGPHEGSASLVYWEEWSGDLYRGLVAEMGCGEREPEGRSPVTVELLTAGSDFEPTVNVETETVLIDFEAPLRRDREVEGGVSFSGAVKRCLVATEVPLFPLGTRLGEFDDRAANE